MARKKKIAEPVLEEIKEIIVVPDDTCADCSQWVESHARRAGVWSSTKEFQAGFKTEIRRVHEKLCKGKA